MSRLEFLPEEDHEKVWALIKDWLATQPDDDARQALRETIRKNAFTRRAKVRGVKQPVKDRARQAYGVSFSLKTLSCGTFGFSLNIGLDEFLLMSA